MLEEKSLNNWRVEETRLDTGDLYIDRLTKCSISALS
jgi:hypothetical protein